MKNFASWQNIQDMLRRRIIDGTWKPGELIPSEKRLAEEFQCARATVNRALRGLADKGLLDRRRRAGSVLRTETVPLQPLNQ
ncbi:MAG: GntR family transcriptional regulator, partial [Gammaproteobacteria bacterium]|nr:GntR family transcriptional regulator [Gammaproteobacteria bacterium]